MPGAKSPVKSSGDIHPPEVEDTVPGLPDDMGSEGTPRDTERASASDRARDLEERPGQGENQAGFLKDKDGDLRGRGGS